MKEEFGGRTVLVTGAGRPYGMGAAVARALARRGAKVVISDLCREQGEALARDIGEACRYTDLDVRRSDDWDMALAAAADFGGALHGLVNNAAIYVPKRLHKATEDEFRQHMEVNQLGPFLGMKHAAPLIAGAGGGSVVNVSSSAGLKGSARSFAYSASKWALRGMTKSAAQELAKDGIRVNSIHPGPICTEMLETYSEPERAERWSMVPLGREGSPTEVAELICFLLSDRSAYMTGAEIAIDGGVTL